MVANNFDIWQKVLGFLKDINIMEMVILIYFLVSRITWRSILFYEIWSTLQCRVVTNHKSSNYSTSNNNMHKPLD